MANTLGAKIDKFKTFPFTPKPAARVAPPLNEECFSNLERRVVGTRMVAACGLFVIEVVEACIDSSVKNPRTIDHLGIGTFTVAGERIKLRSRMKE